MDFSPIWGIDRSQVGPLNPEVVSWSKGLLPPITEAGVELIDRMAACSEGVGFKGLPRGLA